MISYQKNFIYVYFFCPLDFKAKKWVRNTTMTFRLMFGLIGPFTHSALSYGITLEKNGSMENTTITLGTVKPITYRREMDKLPGYCCWAIPATPAQQLHMKTIAEQIQSNKDAHISKIKLFGIDRVIPCFYNGSLTNEFQDSWTCSELTMFLLDKSGIIKADKNPRLYTPTAIYKELAMKEIGEDMDSCEFNYKKFME